MSATRKSGPAQATLALCAAAVTAVTVATPAEAAANPRQMEVAQKSKPALTPHQLHVLHVQHMKNKKAKAAASSVSRKARIAVNYAKAQVGDAYRYGGSGPRAFDCSGLTMAAWRQAGVKLPHRAKSQFARGKKVSRAALRPGDLVFFYSSKSHVGVYIGGGRMVHAANPRRDVAIDKINTGYWKKKFVGARRIA